MTAELQERPPSAPPTSAPGPIAQRLDAIAARRRRLDEQLVSLQAFERRLSDEVRGARKSHASADRVRETLSRLLGVRARISDTTVALARSVEDEEQLRDAARAEEERLEQTRREAQEREDFYLACLQAPQQKA
ncbi:hypothetical protein ACR9E3_16760 [Actinomycetospora sp. C-140]